MMGLAQPLGSFPVRDGNRTHRQPFALRIHLFPLTSEGNRRILP
jgi:hypothetical protein